jgi:ATP-dependent DNA ligase
VTPGTVHVPPCHRYIPRRHITPDATEELKLDGYRLLSVRSGGKLTLRSRRGTDMTRRFKVRPQPCV